MKPVLRTTAQRMRGMLGDVHLLARLGGDDFAIVFKTGTTLSQASTLGDRLSLALWQQVGTGSDQLTVSASIGIACSRRRDFSLATLMRWADQELYRAKAAGKNRVCIRDDDEFPELPTAA